MPNSLTVGGRPKKSRGARLMEFTGADRLRFVPTAKFQVPVVAALPGTCAVGELVANGADANKLYECTTLNTWTKVGTQA